jgi:hypothetical protein
MVLKVQSYENDKKIAFACGKSDFFVRDDRPVALPK